MRRSWTPLGLGLVFDAITARPLRARLCVRLEAGEWRRWTQVSGGYDIWLVLIEREEDSVWWT